MNIIYLQEDLEDVKYLDGKSIFLAGPTPIKDDSGLFQKTFNLFTENTKSWRNEALSYFKKEKFKGTILIPEERNGDSLPFEWDSQIDWEQESLKKSDIILFWIPRDLNDLPGFTTNIEFGYWVATNPSKIIVGAPKNTPKMKYIKYLCDVNKVDYIENLEKIIKKTIKEKC